MGGARKTKVSGETSPSEKHLGIFVRNEVLDPKGLSVTDAAKLIGITRPNLSNFLNGKTNLTADMAARIERAFGVPAKALLDKQAEYDAAKTSSKASAFKSRTFVPPFLKIKANQVEAWCSGSISSVGSPGTELEFAL